MRPYQCEACDAIGLAIANRKLEMLVAMATGTGKTFTVVNLIYRLMKSVALMHSLLSQIRSNQKLQRQVIKQKN